MKSAKKWDVVDFLDTEEDMVDYLNAALEDGDPVLVAAAIGDVARARGMSALAEEMGITRDGLYKGLSAIGNPSFAMVYKVLKALGYQIDVSIAHTSC